MVYRKVGSEGGNNLKLYFTEINDYFVFISVFSPFFGPMIEIGPSMFFILKFEFFGSSTFAVEFMKSLRPESGPQSGKPWR